MRKFSARRQNASQGQSLLESVLVLLAFVILLIGLLDVGQVLFLHQTLVERTRAALRFGAVQRPFDADAVRNMVLYNQPTVPGESGLADNRDGELPEIPGIFGLMPSMVNVQRHDATFNEDRITIQITGYPFRFYTPLIAGLYEGKPIEAGIPYEAGN